MKRMAALILAGVSLGHVPAFADCVWKGVSGKWSVAENWTGGVPTKDDIAVFPKKTAGYTVEVDQDAVCKFLRGDSSVSGGGTVVVFTGDGTLTASGSASGPSVNSYVQEGYVFVFRDIAATIAAFNPYNGTLRIEDGADVTITKAYVNGANSKVTVDGGALRMSGLDFRTAFLMTVNAGDVVLDGTFGCRTDGEQLIVNGGSVSVSKFDFKYDGVNRAGTVRLTGGTLSLGDLPVNFDQSTIDIAGGTLVWDPDNGFDADRHAAWAPKAGARLVLNRNHYQALAVSAESEFAFDGAVYATNNLAGAEGTNTGAPGVFLNTNSVVRGMGELTANYLFIRSTTAVEVARLNLGARVHFANGNSVLRVPNGITLGAYADWTSKYNNAFSYLFGPITVDTSDCFDGMTPRTITLGRTVLDKDVDYRVTGCGTNRLGTGQIDSDARSVTVDAGATFLLDGYYGDDRRSTLSVGELSLGADSTLALRARRSSILAKRVTADPTAKIEIDVSTAPLAAQAMPLLTDSGLADLSSSVELTGTHADEVEAKSVAGTLYLTDGTTPALTGDLPAHTWTGAAGGNWSDAANWYSNAVPVNSTTSAKCAWLHFTGTRSTVVTNDLAGSQDNYRGGAGVFGLHFDATCAPYEIHGNSIRLSPTSYSTESSAFYSVSKNPVVVYAPLWRQSKFGIIVGGGSYAQFMGPVEASGSNNDFYLRGDVRFGGAASAGGLLFYNPLDADNPDKLTILNGGSLYLSNNTIVNTFGESNKAPSASITVDAGGTFAVAAPVFQPGSTTLRFTVDGYFAASNGVRFLRNASFNGTGTVYLAGVFNTNVTRQVTFGGGLTLAMGGDWNAVSTENPDTPVTLAATGDLTLVAAADWTYAADELSVAEGKCLTFGASDRVTSLVSPLQVDGAVAFAAGSKLALRGDLADAADLGWTPVVTAASVSGSPTVGTRLRLRTVENSDGSVSLEAKARQGLFLLLK